jgi:predicted Zn-dependent peptidase
VEAVLTKLAAAGPTEDDMVVAKTRLRAQDALSLAGTYARAEDLGESWIAFGDPLAGLRLRDEIVAVTAAEIRGLAHRMLHELPRYELVVLPTGSDEEA